jgi:hypothetical protein
MSKGDRQATCLFADLIQQTSETKGRLLGAVGEDARYCLAAFLLTRSPGSAPEVVALGSGEPGMHFRASETPPAIKHASTLPCTFACPDLPMFEGTKFLTEILCEDDRPHGRRVHDCHAEPLARRGLLRWLYAEIREVLRTAGSEGTLLLPPESVLAWAEEEAEEEEEEQGGPSTSGQDQQRPGQGHDRQQEQRRRRRRRRLRLKEGAALHFYCSSCPCGNAALRRWALAGKGGDASLGAAAAALPEHEWPAEEHGPLSLHAVREGQVQLLVKKDPGADRRQLQEEGGTGARAVPAAPTAGDSLGGNAEAAAGPAGSAESAGSAAVGGRKAVVSCTRDGMLPPGTAPAGEPGSGVLLSCSDKVALWTALGLQGALLSRFLRPLRPATVTVHRKFSRPHLQRALCCRLGAWLGLRGVPHPTLLSPASLRVFDSEREDSAEAFGSGLAVCWWAGAPAPVQLNGRTGLPFESPEGPPPQQNLYPDASLPDNEPPSPICKAAFLNAYVDLCEEAGISPLPMGGGGHSRELRVYRPDLYRLLKQQAGPQYDREREELLSSPNFFMPGQGTAGHPSGSKRRVCTGYSRKL